MKTNKKLSNNQEKPDCNAHFYLTSMFITFSFLDMCKCPKTTAEDITRYSMVQNVKYGKTEIARKKHHRRAKNRKAKSRRRTKWKALIDDVSTNEVDLPYLDNTRRVTFEQKVDTGLDDYSWHSRGTDI